MPAPAAIVQQQRAAPGPAPTPPPGVLPLSPGDRGPDVSGYQPNTDWSAVASSGRKFAFVKASESTNYVNPYFSRDWPAIAAAGLVRGAYHFARPSVNRAEDEVSWFCGVLGQLGAYDIPVLDTEDPNVDANADLSAWTITFLQGVQQRAGRPCWLYSGPWYLAPHNLQNPDVAAAAGGLWLAAYSAAVPPVPRGWEQHGIGFWQHTDSASVPGVAGACDESIYKP